MGVTPSRVWPDLVTTPPPSLQFHIVNTLNIFIGSFQNRPTFWGYENYETDALIIYYVCRLHWLGDKIVQVEKEAVWL